MAAADPTRGGGERLLEVRDLSTSFFTPEGEVKAVDRVSFHVDVQEIIGVVGESGCGKSVTQLSVLQLVPSPPGKIVQGEVLFEGTDLLRFAPTSREMLSIRGHQISMVFQEPMTSLNPVFTVGNQLTEVIRVHLGLSSWQAYARAARLLESVGIPEPERRLKSYPFELSGGMRQRVMIAMAISCNARLIIADEPTTALDVTTQAQVMELLLSLVRSRAISLIVVTHNLGLVARYVKRIYVMYAGRIVESGATEDILSRPRHPYTLGLLRSVPRLDGKRGEQLVPIPGSPPSLRDLPPKCAFLPRCRYAAEVCRATPFPPLRPVGAREHFTACHRDIAGETR